MLTFGYLGVQADMRGSVEEQDEIPGHSVGGLDVKMEVGRNLGLRKSKQDYKKEGRRERKFKRKFFFPYASV